MFCDQCGVRLAANARFCPSCGRAMSNGKVQMMPADNRVARHIHLLGILWMAAGALNLLSAVAVWFAGRFVLPSVGVRLPGFIPALLGGVAFFTLLKAAGCLVAGWGLMERQSWARVLAIVLAFISLLNAPFGTALGIYTLWVLLSQRTGEEYERLVRVAA